MIAVSGALGWYYARPAAEPVILSVAAGPLGGDSYSLLLEVAEVLERHSDSVRLSVKASKNSSTNISQINRGEIDLATISSDTPVATSIRLIADLFADYFILITRVDRPILSVPDLTVYSPVLMAVTNRLIS